MLLEMAAGPLKRKWHKSKGNRSEFHHHTMDWRMALVKIASEGGLVVNKDLIKMDLVQRKETQNIAFHVFIFIHLKLFQGDAELLAWWSF